MSIINQRKDKKKYVHFLLAKEKKTRKTLVKNDYILIHNLNKTFVLH